jgi:integrase
MIMGSLYKVLTDNTTEILPLTPESARNYIHHATSDNTRRAYRHDIRHFLASGGTLPTTAEAVITYLHNQAECLNTRTLTRRLTALKNWHIYQGFADPTSHPMVRKTLTGISNVHGRPKEKALALQIDDMIRIASYLQSQEKLKHCRNNALLQIGFFGAFRRSELVAIEYAHLNFVSAGLEILIPRSKTDQGGQGTICAIPYGNEQLCPPTALRNWCERAAITEGPVFRGLRKNGQLTPHALSANDISGLVKTVIADAGLPHANRYSAHSLRRGFATTAGQQGVSLSGIMKHGRWKNSDTALGYIEEGQRFESNAAGLVLKNKLQTPEPETPA